MPYVRINMVEFKSKEDMRKDMETLHNNINSIFPEMRLFIAMEASETSNVGIAVYDNKEAADRSLEGRRKHMDEFNVSDVFFHEGKILAFYADNEQIDNLVKSVS